LLENTVFCSLDDLNFKLPGCAEVLHPVQMDEELAENYDHIEREIKSSLRSMIAAGSKAAISILLNTLSGWPDHPYGFNSVGYFNSVGQWVHVTEPPELDQGTLRNKERKLLELVKDSVARGRQVWIYVEMTVKRDIQVRLESLLKAEGLDVRVLRSNTVKASEREEWIRQNATANVVISNPALVKTGLDLFDRSGVYNFSTLIFYQTGYQLDTLRQAAARSNRIGQWLECEVHYLFYADTMQESCVSLMAQKTNAAQAIEGKLTTSGLAASIEIEASAAMALAKMLIAKNDTQRVARPSVPVASCLPGVTVPTAQILSKSEPIPLPIQSPSRPMSHSSQVQPQYVVTEARMKQWVHQANAIRQAFTTVAQGSKARQMLKQLAKCLELLAQEERLKVESAMDWGNLCQLAQTTQVPLRAVRLEPAGA
jgi:hypothetical protein